MALAAQQEADRETVPLKEAVRRQWPTVPLVAPQEADRKAAAAALDLKEAPAAPIACHAIASASAEGSMAEEVARRPWPPWPPKPVRRQWPTVPLVAPQQAGREAAVAAPLDLEEAVRQDKFELAASLRDRLRNLGGGPQQM